MMRIATALLLAILILRCGAFPAKSENNTGSKSIPELQEAIERVLKETRTPGAGIAIVSRDKVEWVAGLGKADVAANKSVTPETLFRIGSVSKGFAALAALKLQEEGKLRLTDTVRQWVPEVAFTNPWEASNPVRLIHLMEHTSGFDDIHLREYALNSEAPIELQAALAYGANSRVCRWPPGTRMAYCNSGPAVLAAVIEKVSGQRFEDYVKEHFFDPLHMNTASYFYTPAVQEGLAKLYHSGGVTPYPYWHIAFRSAGSINASARDMANYVRFYLERGSLNGTELLKPSSIERMERMESLPSAKLGNMAGYGLYNAAILEGPFVFHGHGGAVMGGVTEMGYLPDNGCGYVVMLNSGNGKALYRIARLVRQYLTRDLTPPALPPARPERIPKELQQHYAGYYQGISPRSQWLYGVERLVNVRKLQFSSRGCETTIYGLTHKRWVQVSERLFRQEDQSVATLALLPDSNGDTLMQYTWGTFKKVSAWRIWGQVVGIVVVSVIIASAFLFAPIWVVRTLFGKLPRAASGPLAVRVVPLLSAVLLIAFDGLLVAAMLGMITAGSVDDVSSLGVRNWLTVSIMVLSVAFPSVAGWSLYVVWRERKTVMNRVAYWHSVLVGIAVGAVAIYYGYWGLVGLRLWA